MQIKGLIIMGVSGCGKSTAGKLIAMHLGWEFIEGDEYHTPENIVKMSGGIPLTDTDRASWLVRLNALLSDTIDAGKSPVLACSALKAAYRLTLLRGINGMKIVYLKGSYHQILSRMTARTDHYMKPGMLESQFSILEEPDDAWVIDIGLTPEEIAGKVIELVRNEGME